MKNFFRIISVAVTLCILLSLLVVAPLGAVFTLAPKPELLWSYNTTYAVTDIATGDLNGDGKDDVVAIEKFICTLTAISGADGSPLWSDNTTSGNAVAIGDITGDGQNEVIAGGYDADFLGMGGNVINVYAANGTLLWPYPTTNMVHDIEIGDVDGDGIDDVVACNGAVGSNIYVLKYDGPTPSVPDGWPVAVNSTVVDLALGQLDGIAGVDVAAIGQSELGTLYVYDSSGDDPLWHATSVSGTTVEIGDVDGDGDNEVVAPYYGTEYPPDVKSSGFGIPRPIKSYGWVLAFDGDEGGNALYSFNTTEDKLITDIELDDLDGEPGVEIAAITNNPAPTLFAIDIDNSSEQVMWTSDFSWENSGYYGESLAIGDVDRDYKNEVVAANSMPSHYVYAFDGIDKNGDGDGDMVWAPFSVENAITDVEIGDLDGDGDQDVAFGTKSPKTLYAIAKMEEPFTSATGTGIVYIDSDPSSIGNPTAVDPATLPDEGKPDISFPHGLFSFNITGLDLGQTATVTITLPAPLPMTAEYWKYGPTPGNNTDHWYQLPMGDNDGDNVITIELTDGGIGDDDLTPDGTIIDDGGPGYYIPVGGEAFPVGNSSNTALWISVVIALIWATAALLMLRRQQN